MCNKWFKLSLCGVMSAVTVATATEKIAFNERGVPPAAFPPAGGDNWRFFPVEWQMQPLSDNVHADFALSATVRVGDYAVEEPPYDTGNYCRFMSMAQLHYQAAIVFRHQADGADCYRVQFSVSDQSVALWKSPGNFLAVADCPLEAGKPFAVKVTASGSRLSVAVDGKPVLTVVDRIDPLAAGALFVAANRAQVTVTDVAIQTFPESSDPVSISDAHKPNFAVRNWCGYRWIFDGSEPVARLAEGKDSKSWQWHPIALTEVKLRPGTRAADFIPLQFRGAGNWPEKPMDILSTAADTVKLRAFTSDRRPDKEPTVQTVCDVTIAYDAARNTYVYTLDNTMTYLTERPAVVEIMDPWPYGVCGPALGAERNWDSRYSHVLWRDQDEKLYRYPLNHFLLPPEPRLSKTAPRLIFWGEADVNPTYEILEPSKGREFKIGLCTTMLDMHVQYADLPKVIPTGTVQKDCWRFSSTHGRELDKLNIEPGWHSVWQKQENGQAALFDPHGTTFDGKQVVAALTPHHAQAFLPHQWYVIDPEVGHHDKGSLMMDLQHGTHTVKVGEGLSYFGTAFDGTAHVLRLYVKTVDLEGTFQVSIKLPGNRVAASEPLTGSTDGWRLVELQLTPLPGDYAAFINLEMTGPRGGKGQVWIDDISFKRTTEM